MQSVPGALIRVGDLHLALDLKPLLDDIHRNPSQRPAQLREEACDEVPSVAPAATQHCLRGLVAAEVLALRRRGPY